LLIALFVVVATARVTLHESDSQAEFVNFLSNFQKQYTADNFFHRFNIFKNNLVTIREHNKKGLSWTMGVNQFSDMTSEEFSDMVGKFPERPASSNAELFRPTAGFVAPDSWDWRTKGAVTPVKDQRQCGSCWAFSTVGALEGWNQITFGQLLSFSEQQLVDCSKDTCYGCQGGWPYKATEYVQQNGICLGSDYPYKGVDGQCKDKQCTPAIKPGALKGYFNISGEKDMLEAVTKGPVEVLVEADRSAFQFYRSGTLDDASCGQDIDHAITLVGYGTDTTGKNYWIVKNSWGSSWGANGYIMLVRDKNMCGINTGPVQPKPEK